MILSSIKISVDDDSFIREVSQFVKIFCGVAHFFLLFFAFFLLQHHQQRSSSSISITSMTIIIIMMPSSWDGQFAIYSITNITSYIKNNYIKLCYSTARFSDFFIDDPIG
jgi:hypothetical protein